MDLNKLTNALDNENNENSNIIQNENGIEEINS